MQTTTANTESSMAGFLSSASTAAASRGHHHHTFAEEANEPPPPTLSRLPPDGHEFPPDYRDPAASTISYQVQVQKQDWNFSFYTLKKIHENLAASKTFVLVVFPRKLQTDQSALQFLFMFWFLSTENLTGFLHLYKSILKKSDF